MPRLTPQTHETFAELVAAGNPLPESAFAAGLKWNPSYARKLARRPEIIQRIAELSKREQAIKLKRDGPDEDFILTPLARNLDLARQALDMKHANATLQPIGKHFGLFNGRPTIRRSEGRGVGTE